MITTDKFTPETTTRIHFANKKRLMQIGNKADFIFHLEKGVLRKVIEDSNSVSDETKEIYLPGDFIFPLDTSTSTQNTDFYIEALSTGTVKKIPLSVLSFISGSHLQEIFCHSLKKQEWLNSVLRKSAEEKYVLFTRRFGTEANKIPLNIIASFLNMNISTLSKVRKEIFTKDHLSLSRIEVRGGSIDLNQLFFWPRPKLK